MWKINLFNIDLHSDSCWDDFSQIFVAAITTVAQKAWTHFWQELKAWTINIVNKLIAMPSHKHYQVTLINAWD